MEKPNMPLAVAKDFLGACSRVIIVDWATEIHWERHGSRLAYGLFTQAQPPLTGTQYVSIRRTKQFAETKFSGGDALALKEVGELAKNLVVNPEDPLTVIEASEYRPPLPEPDAGNPSTWDDTLGDFFTHEKE